MAHFQINLKIYALLVLIFVPIVQMALIVFNARKDLNLTHQFCRASSVGKIKSLKMEDVFVMNLVFWKRASVWDVVKVNLKLVILVPIVLRTVFNAKIVQVVLGAQKIINLTA